MAEIFIMSKCSDIGGVEKSLLATLEVLTAAGHRVDLYLLDLPGPLLDLVPPEVNILSPGRWPDALGEVTLRNFPAYVRYRIASRLTLPGWLGINIDRHYDLAIAYGEYGLVPYLVRDSVRADRKIMYCHHGSYVHSGKRKSRDATCFGSFETIVTVSEANERMLEKVFPKLKDKLTVIPNIVSLNLLHNLKKRRIEKPDWPDASYRILTVGRLVPDKYLSLALHTAKGLKNKGLDFAWYFIGSGPEEKALRRFITKHELTDRCFFIGEHMNPYPYFATCDLYIQTSKVESECLTLKEAMLFDRPIVASDIEAHKETLRKYPNAMLATSDPVVMAEKVIRILGETSQEGGHVSVVEANERSAELILRLVGGKYDKPGPACSLSFP